MRVLVANEQRAGWIWSPAPVNADIYAGSRQAAFYKTPATSPPSLAQLTSFASDTDDGTRPRCQSSPERYPFLTSSLTGHARQHQESTGRIRPETASRHLRHTVLCGCSFFSRCRDISNVVGLFLVKPVKRGVQETAAAYACLYRSTPQGNSQ